MDLKYHNVLLVGINYRKIHAQKDKNVIQTASYYQIKSFILIQCQRYDYLYNSLFLLPGFRVLATSNSSTSFV